MKGEENGDRREGETEEGRRDGEESVMQMYIIT